jgi:hypothetical protein
VALKSGNLKLLETSGPVLVCNGIALPFTVVWCLVNWIYIALTRGTELTLPMKCVAWFRHNCGVYPVSMCTTWKTTRSLRRFCADIWNWDLPITCYWQDGDWTLANCLVNYSRRIWQGLLPDSVLHVSHCRSHNRAPIIQTQTADMGWSSSLGVGRGANNSSLWKRLFVMKYSKTKAFLG